MMQERRRVLKDLLTTVQRQTPEQLPETLVTRCLHNTAWGYDLEPYVHLLGGWAIDPLTRRYPSATLEVKAAIVEIIGRGQMREGLALVQRGLSDGAPGVRRSAVMALRLIEGRQAEPEFVRLLEDPDATVLTELIRQWQQVDATHAADACLDLVEQDRLPTRAFVETCGGSSAPAESTGTHFDLLLRLLRDSDRSTRFHAVQLIGQLTQREQLVRLSFLLPELLQVGFQEGSTVDMTDRPKDMAGLRGETTWNQQTAATLLQHIATQLTTEDLTRWLHEHERAVFPRLYLTSLLTQRGVPSITTEKPVALTFDVVDGDGTILSHAAVSMTEGQRLTFDDQPTRPETVAYHYGAQLALDREQWRLCLDLTIALQPHGVGFTARIPIGGTYEIQLITRCPIHRQQETLTWRMHHVESHAE